MEQNKAKSSGKGKQAQKRKVPKKEAEAKKPRMASPKVAETKSKGGTKSAEKSAKAGTRGGRAGAATPAASDPAPKKAPKSAQKKRTLQPFRDRLSAEKSRLEALATEWETFIQSQRDPPLPSGMTDDALSAIGQTRLLTSNKFKKFEGLINTAEKMSEPGATGPVITDQDLEGYWDVMFLDVQKLNSKFESLAQQKEAELSGPKKRPATARRSIVTPARAQLPSNTPAVKSGQTRKRNLEHTLEEQPVRRSARLAGKIVNPASVMPTISETTAEKVARRTVKPDQETKKTTVDKKGSAKRNVKANANGDSTPSLEPPAGAQINRLRAEKFRRSSFGEVCLKTSRMAKATVSPRS